MGDPYNYDHDITIRIFDTVFNSNLAGINCILAYFGVCFCFAFLAYLLAWWKKESYSTFLEAKSLCMYTNYQNENRS